jgi:hypothetical protein
LSLVALAVAELRLVRQQAVAVVVVELSKEMSR